MIHHVYANQSNVGDWLSALGIQSLLAPWPVREHFCDAPFVPDTLAALRAAGPEDFIIIGGGGLFMDYFVPFWEGFQPIAARVPFAIWGVGCCDMKREQTRPPLKLISGIMRQSRLCVVRDELTRGIFSDGRLPPPVPCPTFNVVSTVGGAQKRLLHVDHFDNVGAEHYAAMQAAAEKHAAATGRSLRQCNNLLPDGDRGAAQSLLELYATADQVLTSRLHGCIIALATGRRVLAVSGDHKVESFMRAAGLGAWVCDLDEVLTLPARLEKLAEQQLPEAFVAGVRRGNAGVADQLRAIIGSGAPVAGPR